MSIATLYQSRLLPGRPRRAFGLRTVCGDKGEAKAVRKRLQRKQYDLEDATAALRTLPLNYDATSQLAVVYNIKVRQISLAASDIFPCRYLCVSCALGRNVLTKFKAIGFVKMSN